MSDLAELKARALKSREFTCVAGECEFTLRTPTRTQMRELMHERGLMRGDPDALVLPLLQHYLLQRGIIGWTGVRYRHVLADAGEAPLPWSADAVDMLLDAQPEWADTMGAKLLSSTQARAEGIEADAKN